MLIFLSFLIPILTNYFFSEQEGLITTLLLKYATWQENYLQGLDTFLQSASATNSTPSFWTQCMILFFYKNINFCLLYLFYLRVFNLRFQRLGSTMIDHFFKLNDGKYTEMFQLGIEELKNLQQRLEKQLEKCKGNRDQFRAAYSRMVQSSQAMLETRARMQMETTE